MEVNQIYNQDCLEGMEEIEDNSIDLIIADPPYNLSEGGELSYSGDWGGGDWDQTNEDWDLFSDGEYRDFIGEWIQESYRVLKDCGSIYVFGTYHNSGEVVLSLKEAGFRLANEIIWFKPNAFPNLQQNRFSASHENIFWAYKEDYKFNYDLLRDGDFPEDPLKRRGKQMRSVWSIPTNKTDEELEYSHPTQKPEKVVDRIILASSDEGDLVLDPFMGSGTTAAVCKRRRRRYLGFEVDEEYHMKSEERLEGVEDGELLDDTRTIKDW